MMRHLSDFSRQYMGWPGLVSVFLLLVLVGGEFVVARPLRQRAEVLQAKLDSGGNQAFMKHHSAQIAPTEPPSQRFLAYFSQPRELTDTLAKLHSAARSQGVELRSADYAIHDVADLPLKRYELTLPVTGNYAQVRAFMESILQEIPQLAIETLSFTRQKPEEPAVAAELRLSIYFMPR